MKKAKQLATKKSSQNQLSIMGTKLSMQSLVSITGGRGKTWGDGHTEDQNIG